jgi:hypothetical protein
LTSLMMLLGGLMPLAVLGALIVAVLSLALRWERYRAKLSPGAMPTSEVFVDPETGGVVRVWIDPATGTRDYRPETAPSSLPPPPPPQ